MDRENRKVEQLRTRYEQLKKRIRDWELAVLKTEGRKPNKDDMKLAPSTVQASYRDLVKIRKYLEEVVATSADKKKNELTLTPGKIFLGVGKHRRQLQRTDHAYLTRTPSKVGKRSLSKPDTGSFGLQTKTRPSSKDSPGSSAFPFKKLFNTSKVFEAQQKAASANKTSTSEDKNLDTSLGKDDSSLIVERSALLPDKLLKETKSLNDDGHLIDENTISSIIMSLSESITNDEDASCSTNFSAGSQNESSTMPPACFTFSPFSSSLGANKNVSFATGSTELPQFSGENLEDTTVRRKRSARLAFSTSPEKPKLKNFCHEDDAVQTNISAPLASALDEFEDSGLGIKQAGSMEGSMAKGNDDDNSRSTTNSSSHNESEDSGVGRKRPFSFAFSPSPEKKQKRKFFKSSKGDRATRAVFSWNSYKPASPVKKSNKSTDPVAKKLNPPKIRRVTRAASRNKDESMEDADDEDFEPKDSLYSPPPAVKLTKKKVEPKKKSTRTKKVVKYDESEDGKSPLKEETPASKSYVIDIFDESSQPVIKIKKKGARWANARNQTMDSKLSNGKVDENFVRINTKKKVFVRGHKKISAVKMKRLDWKQRKSMQGKEAMTNSFTCHKCGEKGHFAKFCKKDTVADEEPPGEQDDSPFPTLEEAARMVNKNSSTTTRVNVYMLNKITEETNADVDGSGVTEDNALNNDTLSAEMSEPLSVNTAQLIESVDPFFNGEDTSCTETESEIMKEGIQAFGYDDFRPGQREAVYRVLKGLSTLLILSTGSGKSLCYQLPAYLYQKKYPGALTLCVSPLVSLMEDQVQGIPPFLNAACLHSGMTTKQKSVVLDRVKARKLHILLVSPEAVCGGLFGLLKGTGHELPKISFACIDEVHCVSQWSHNFRPSYLQLCKILREKLNVKTILGLTATATEATSQSICEHLNIDPSTTIRGELIPRNLKLSVSRDVYKDEALLNLLRGERFRECDSIIIYCTRREECERIATLVRIKMQEVSTHKVMRTKSGARLSSSCEAYHAGMTSRRRKNVQNGFMSGEIRIVVATVAFGMGIDKSDIRAVIHYNMPSTFESYVQEIGRAGRDGLPAHCHLFLDNSRRNDLCELKRHVYANSVDRPTIRKLLRKVFLPCKCGRIEKLRGHMEPGQSKSDISKCPGHEVSFSIDDTVTDLDLPKENITTLLCYLELGEKKWIEILPLTYEICKIQAYGGAKLLKSAASRCPPLAVAIALQREKNKFREADTYLEFNVIEAAATVGWNSSVVKKELKNLEWIGSAFDDKGNPTKFRKSGLLVEFSNLAYRVKSSSLTDEQADEVLNSLHGRNLRQEQTELYQLQRVYQALLSVSFPNVNNLCDTFDEEKNSQLKKFIYDYFTENTERIKAGREAAFTMETQIEPGKDEELRRSIRQLVDSNRDINFTTRSIARIFQGISSPCFPADVWYRNKDFWRRYLDIDFHLICRIAAEEL